MRIETEHKPRDNDVDGRLPTRSGLQGLQQHLEEELTGEAFWNLYPIFSQYDTPIQRL